MFTSQRDSTLFIKSIQYIIINSGLCTICKLPPCTGENIFAHNAWTKNAPQPEDATPLCTWNRKNVCAIGHICWRSVRAESIRSFFHLWVTNEWRVCTVNIGHFQRHPWLHATYETRTLTSIIMCLNRRDDTAWHMLQAATQPPHIWFIWPFTWTRANITQNSHDILQQRQTHVSNKTKMPRWS